MAKATDSRRVFLSEMGLVIVAMIWGLTFVTGKWAMDVFEVEWILFIRFLLSSTIMGLLFRKEWSKLDAYTLTVGGLYGFLFAFGLWTQMTGLKYTTPAKQSFLLMFYVVFVPMFELILFKTKPNWKIIPSAIGLFVGVGMVSLKAGEGLDLNIGGDGMTIIYALVFGLQIALMGRIAPKIKSVVMFTLVQFVSATLFYGIMLIALQEPVLKFGLGFGDLEVINWIGFLFLLTFNSMVGFVLQNVAQRYARPTNAALLISTESIFGAIAAYFLDGEEFNIQKTIGVCVIFASIVFYQLDFGSKKKAA